MVMDILCSMVMTADGYIARVDGRSTSSPFEWEGFEEEVQKYDNFVIGRKTFELAHESLAKIECKHRIVMSAEPGLKASKGFTIVKSPEEAIAHLRGKVDTLFLVGGNITNTSFLQRGLITHLEIIVQPLIIGNGMPLFSPFELEQKLQLVSCDAIDGNRAKLSYKVI